MSKSSQLTNEQLNRFLGDVNDELGALEERLIRAANGPAQPPVFIVGLQRSGTTLLNQLMLRHWPFFYSNNLLARYWKTPVVGTLWSLALSEYMKPSDKLESHLGYTEGIGGSHEFGYFWKQYFPTGVKVGEPTLDLQREKYERLTHTLRAMSVYAASPLLFKNIVQLALNVNVLKRLLPEALFIEIRRDSYFVAQSTYLSRKKLHGHEQGWFGIVPEGVETIKGAPPIQQVAWQVRSAEEQLSKALEDIAPEHLLRVAYEDLVANPVKELKDVSNFLASHRLFGGETVTIEGIEELPSGNVYRLEQSQQEELEKWLNQ